MFPGFALADFDCYLPERAGSNVFNRQRLEVKQKLEEIVRAAEPAARAAGLPVDLVATDHTPSVRNSRRVDCQWVGFARTGGERDLVEEVLHASRDVTAILAEPAPETRHAVLGIGIDLEGVSSAARVCSRALVDAANLRGLLRDPDGRDRFLAALRALPDGFAVTAGGAAPTPAGSMDAAALDSALGTFTEHADAWFEVGRRLGRADAAAAGSGLLAAARESLDALVGVYRLLAWSPNNDRIGFDALIDRVRAARAIEESEHEREERAFRERRAESVAAARERTDRMVAERDASKTRRGTREVAPSIRAPFARRDEPAPRASERPAPPDAVQRPGAVEDEAARPKPTGRPAGPAEPRREPPAHPPARPKTPPVKPAVESAVERPAWSRGDLVRILVGPLRGRVGTFSEADSHGHLRVMLGLLTARLTADDIGPPLRR